jgi:PilZ domain-containing protein
MSHGSERRAAPRFEIFAQASVLSGEDMYLMSVRNISADGAFLEGRAKEHPDLKPGVALEIVVSAAKPGMDDDDVINISCTGQVVRVELGTAAHPGGFGITLEPIADADAEQLANLLRQLADERFADRAAGVG